MCRPPKYVVQLGGSWETKEGLFQATDMSRRSNEMLLRFPSFGMQCGERHSLGAWGVYLTNEISHRVGNIFIPEPFFTTKSSARSKVFYPVTEQPCRIL